MPWGPRSSLPEPDPGHVWRHEVYGGLYDLSRVRDVLVSQYGQDQDEEPPPKGKSALFACTVDEKGFLVEDSMVVSACAWGTGRVVRGDSPIGDMAADTAHYADSLARQAKVRAGVRVLGAALREAAPEGVSGAVSAAAAGVLGPLGPIGVGLAAAAAKTAKSLAESAVGGKEERGRGRPASRTTPATAASGEATRLDLIAIAGEDLHAFVDGLADGMGVAGGLPPVASGSAATRSRSTATRRPRPTRS